MENRTIKQLMLHFIAGTALLLGAAALIVFLVDPFFHYHKPWFGLSAVQVSHQYQVPGVLDHLEYDSILLGASVVMSMNTDELDERFDCTTVKAVGNSAAAPLLHYYMERAYKSHEVKNIFYGLDVFSFYNDPDMQVIPDEAAFIANENIFDDVKYLWNGAVLGEKVPEMIELSRSGTYSPGYAYQLNQNKEYGPEVVLSQYGIGTFEKRPSQPIDYQNEYVEENISRLEECVRNHPETEFKFFTPPYSIMWWFRACDQGLMDTYVHTLKRCMGRLLQYENVKFYATDFNKEEIITNLNYYMDLVHGGPQITERMAREIGNSGQEITLENYEQQIGVLEDIAGRYAERIYRDGIEFFYE